MWLGTEGEINGLIMKLSNVFQAFYFCAFHFTDIITTDQNIITFRNSSLLQNGGSYDLLTIKLVT
jgi:hypothetical protein